MLQELDIDSYAVVERLRLRFRAGLNLLTGETGSGKSIVVDSLALLFGARGSSDVVRPGARRARISGIFDLPRGAGVRAWLQECGIDADGEDLIVERQILASGKSRAYVNGTPATMALLRGLAAYLGDIHGQHEQQTLLSPGVQLRMLDEFAGITGEVRALGEAYRRWSEIRRQLGRLKGDEQERLRRMDLLRYQAAEIRSAEVQLGEDDELGREQARLAHAERLQQGGFEAYSALYDASASASAQIKSAASALDALTAYEDRFAPFVASLEAARSAVDDVAFDLRSYLERLEARPDRQEAVEERLALLDKLKRKYGPSLAEVLDFGRQAEQDLAALESSESEAERLEGELEVAAGDYLRAAEDLSRRRHGAADLLAERTKAELQNLALGNAMLQVRLEPLDAWGPTGIDRTGLLFSANPDQPPRPLGQAASGGELSRVALAFKTSLQESAAPSAYRRTLVFDEVDTGVGGSVAEAIGRRLRKLAGASQVLCVTHQPQIARFAGAHFHVSKAEADGRTTAAVAELDGLQRVKELARMLSGSEITEAALANARQLLMPDTAPNN